MKIIFSNIGMIQNAEIDLNKNITLIAGENNSGKSTVGKMLYIVVNTFNRQIVENNFKDMLISRVNSTVNDFYFNLRSNFDGIFINSSKHNNARKDKISSEFRNLFIMRNRILKEINPYLKKVTIGKVSIEELDYIKSLFETTLNINEYDIDEQIKINNYINVTVEEIINVLNTKINLRDEYIKRFNLLSNSLFKGPLSSIGSINKSNIKILEGNNLILNIIFDKDQILEFSFIDDLYFDDATLIESPIIIDYQNLIQNAHSLLDIQPFGVNDIDMDELVDNSSKDLINKLRRISYNQNLTFDIDKIIDGHIEYDVNKDDFIYTSNGINFNISSVASGIKSFGIIQMLLNKKILTNRHLLILDEPEVHLHPKWQLKFAELLISISSRIGTKILVTSHSPYFIEALRIYNNSYMKRFENLEENNYYYAQNINQFTSELTNINDNLDIIFDKLAKPFQELEKVSAGDWLND